MQVSEKTSNPNHVSDHPYKISQSVLSSIYNTQTHITDTHGNTWSLKVPEGVRGLSLLSNLKPSLDLTPQDSADIL